MIADDGQDFHKSSDEENPSGLKLETGDFGTIAVRNGLLKREELERCIEKKKKFFPEILLYDLRLLIHMIG